MNAYETIIKKRDGHALAKEEIDAFLSGYVAREIPDYQMAALAMAIYFRDMDDRELTDWTMAMVGSGETIDLSGIPGVKADKHSTGGVGDKTTILFAPWLAATGVKIAKMSGRGLGHTGGTIDKLESIPGFSATLPIEKVIESVNSIGVCIAGQTGNLAPADKMLYALRDVTGTTDSVPLIASSVMSKKIAAGADAILLDVKTGSGAFITAPDDAMRLAKAMVGIGRGAGRKTAAVISSMDEPLGYAVGNSIEVREAVEVLKGNGPDDVRLLCEELGAQLLIMTGNAADAETGKAKMRATLESGLALEKFREMVANQGGDASVADDYGILPKATIFKDILAGADGYISAIDGQEIGFAVKGMGGGREKLDDVLDLSVGVTLEKKIGDKVARGERIAVVQGNKADDIAAAAKRIADAYSYSKTEVGRPALIYGTVT